MLIFYNEIPTQIYHKRILYHCHYSIPNVPIIEFEYAGATVVLQKGCNSTVIRQEITVCQIRRLYG